MVTEKFKLALSLILLLIFGTIYLPSTVLAQGDAWITKKNMPDERAGHASCVMDGIIYVIGGVSFESNPNALSTVLAYNPSTDTWDTLASVPTARMNLSAAALNGKIYVMGGQKKADDRSPLNLVEEYDPIANTWTTKAPMITPRDFFGTCAVNGKIYAIGGLTADGQPLKSIEEYDPVANTWIEKTPMSIARNYLSFSIPVVNEKIYVMGGATGISSGMSLVEEYDPVSDSWTTKKDMPTARVKLATSAVNGMIYAIGGSVGPAGNGFKMMEEYDPATDNWLKRTDMPTPRMDFTTAAVNGKIYAIGGIKGYSPIAAVYEVQEYLPSITSVSNYHVDQAIIKGFLLYQNYPNPFNPTTTISYTLAKDIHAKLTVYNTLGQVVAVLVDGYQAKGSYYVKWDAKNHPSGIYLYKLEAGGFSTAKKMFLQK